MDPAKAHEFHGKLKENAEELNDYVRDLNNWLKDIKKKDEELRNKQHEVDDFEYPPIRNSKKTSKADEESCILQNTDKMYNSQELHTESCENKKLSDVNNQKVMSDVITADMKETERRRVMERAEMEKEKGNTLFKKGNYDDAIACYTMGIDLDPTNAILPANRAMAFMKKGQFAEAETDCTKSITQDPTYVKAFHRRGVCRFSLKKYQLARQDFLKVMELDPGNKHAKAELVKLEKIFESKGRDDKLSSTTNQLLTRNSIDTSIVKAINKPLHLQSKKPLKRIQIEAKEDGDCNSKSPEIETMEGKTPSKAAKTAQTPVKDIISPVCAPHLPPVPHTAFQFLSDWKKLHNFPECQHQYIKQLPPAELPKIFKEAMEIEILTDVLCILKENIQELGNETVLSYLQYIPQVGRFKTLVLFISDEEKKVIKSLLDIVCCGKNETLSELSSLYRII